MESSTITTLLKQNLYILYGSQTGNAQEISGEIYDLLKKSFNCKYSSLNDTISANNFTFINNEEIPIIIIVCSTTGNGDAPGNANFFWRKIKNRSLPKDLLNNIKYTVLGLGDTNYDKFCQMGKNLDKRFDELGGNRIIELHCADEAVGLEDTVNIFIEKLMKYFTVEINSDIEANNYIK
jgi:methionine synthase reductase